MSKREANPLLMAYWMHEWQTLGRWQALNSRLSRQVNTHESGWASRCSANYSPAGSAAVSTTRRIVVNP